jgi:undecaprenyl-diphosphatase
MDFGWALFYGFIQGVSEFLPISSSGHLALIPFFFKLEDPGVLFDLLMHLGTAIAVILYFRKEVYELIIEFKNLLITRNLKESVFVQNFLLSTFASFVLILAIKDISFSYGRAANIIGFNFIFFGILMYFADKKGNKGVDLTKQKSLKNSILIGLSQSLAVFPGVSRSGITLTSSRYLGMGRVEASRFSFLLSLPVIIGGILFKIPEIMNGSIESVDYSIMIFGILFSFLFGIITIHIFLKMIAKIGLVYFSIYRVAVGVLLVYLSYC